MVIGWLKGHDSPLLLMRVLSNISRGGLYKKAISVFRTLVFSASPDPRGKSVTLLRAIGLRYDTADWSGEDLLVDWTIYAVATEGIHSCGVCESRGRRSRADLSAIEHTTDSQVWRREGKQATYSESDTSVTGANLQTPVNLYE